MKPVHFYGLAVPLLSIAGTGRDRQRFSALAFRDFLRSPAAAATPVKLNHRDPLPRCEAMRWALDSTGLVAAFALDYYEPGTREIALAAAHGWTLGLSISANIFASEECSDGGGRFSRVTDCEIAEVSITAQPRMPGTTLRIAGHPIATSKTWPSDAADRRILEAFVGREGIGSGSLVLPEKRIDLFASRPARLTTGGKATSVAKRVSAPPPLKRPALPKLPASLAKFVGQTVRLDDRVPGTNQTFRNALTLAGYTRGQILDLILDS